MARIEKTKVIFVCQKCGKESPRWLGCCPDCKAWNTFSEVSAPKSPLPNRVSVSGTGARARKMSAIDLKSSDRVTLPMNELNRVLGGGLVAGSVALIAGEPGIGKSTLLLQAADVLAKVRGKVVYVSGEETEQQIKMRAQRLGVTSDDLYLMSETDLQAALNELDATRPGFVVFDSIQTLALPEVPSAAGNITQIRECTVRILQWAKTSNTPVFIVGHVTKSGDIAGPKALEHIVDVVLNFEGSAFSSYRFLRCVKNRYGSTNEVGVFDMTSKGLMEIENPSQAFLSEHQEMPGSAVVPVLEGNRPILLEVQSLATTSFFGMPRRTANGVDFNRLLMIIAVLTKRAGLKLGNQDILVNVAGGLKIEEPAADLSIALSIASSFYNAVVRPLTVCIGEVGLSGELRSAPQMDRRIAECERLGFLQCILPASSLKSLKIPKELKLVPARTVREALFNGLTKNKGKPEPAKTSAEEDLWTSEND